MAQFYLQETITINDTWNKKSNKIKDPVPSDKSNPKPAPEDPEKAAPRTGPSKTNYPPHTVMSSSARGRGGSIAGRGGSKHRPAPLFRSESSSSRSTPRRMENHVTAETAVNWRRAPPPSKANR